MNVDPAIGRDTARRSGVAPSARILVVDDTAGNRALLQRRLRQAGFDVAEADGGPRALEMVESERFDLVLLDVMMPGMSGTTVLSRIRKQIDGVTLPVIMVTARDDPSEIAEALQGGANDYVVKPFNFKILQARIEAQLRQRTWAVDAVTLARDEIDELTGLSSRRGLAQSIAKALVGVRRSGGRGALLVADVDGFSLINANYGLTAGDRVLQHLARSMRASLAPADSVGRVGADSVGLLLCDGTDGLVMERIDVLRCAIAAFMSGLIGDALHLTVGIGVVWVTANDRSVSELLAGAELACAAAQQRGRDQLCIGADPWTQDRRSRAEWALRTRRAIARDELLLFAQPICGTRDRRIVGFEILVRMRDGDQIVPPGLFLPAAAEHGLVPLLDRWVFDALIAQIPKCGTASPCYFAINVSGASVGDLAYCEHVGSQLRALGLPHGQLMFEITETEVIDDVERALAFMKSMQAVGVRFALDDFGAGVSSFGHLQVLPVDCVKIDGRFVRNVGHSPVDRAITAAINTVAQVLGMKTVAEFVEDEQTAIELASIGVDFVQGYHVGRPQPLEAVLIDWHAQGLPP